MEGLSTAVHLEIVAQETGIQDSHSVSQSVSDAGHTVAGLRFCDGILSTTKGIYQLLTKYFSIDR